MKGYKYDKFERVEDSTKGNADLSPRVYKGDVYTQAWIDSRKLATLSIWLDEAGWKTRYLSEVVKFTLDMVLEHLVESGTVKMIEFTEEARDILEAKYRTNLNPGGRGKRNVLHNMVLDDKRKNRQVGGYNPDSRVSYNSIESIDSVRPKDDEQPLFDNKTKLNELGVPSIEELKRIMKEIEHDEVVKNAKEEKERILANADIDENGVITPYGFGDSRGAISQEEYDTGKERDRKREEDEELVKRQRKLVNRIEKTTDKIDEEEIKDGES